MLRMSFMGHLEELRSRILKALAGFGVAFLITLIFADKLWKIVSEPGRAALKILGGDGTFAAIRPMEQFSIIYVEVPLTVACFVAAPWVVYQVWAFVAPGLYKRERRWATPFILCTAGLFILGGLFAYFVAFRFALTFLLGIGQDLGVKNVMSIEYYFDLFFNVTIGIALVFELPVLIFFLTLLRIVKPSFLIKHSRYAILAITIIAAVVTPTPDIFNMMLFAIPMWALFFVGVFASYLLVLKREGKKFPWGLFLKWFFGVVLTLGAILYILIGHFHYHFMLHAPYFTRGH